MTLNEWMTNNDHDDGWLAGQLGCDRTQANRIKRGVSGTSAERAFKIEALTKGQVKAASILLPEQGEAA